MEPGERETIIRTDDSETEWIIWSAKGSRMYKKLIRTLTPRRADDHGAFFAVPFAGVIVRIPKKKTPSPEQREKMQERGRQLAKTRQVIVFPTHKILGE